MPPMEGYTSGSVTYKVVWKAWCATASTTDTTCDEWYSWNTSTSSTTATASTSGDCYAVWKCWSTKNGNMTSGWSEAMKVKETPEQRTAREEAAAKQMERAAELRRQAEEAEARARELLTIHLDDQQRADYEAHKRFYVVGSDGVRYEVDCRNRHRNVFQVNDAGKRLLGFCAFQTGDCPLPDNHLAQKLLLEADAEEFKRVANQFAVAG